MSTTLQADLSWSVRDFQPGRFKIAVQLGKYMGSPPRGNTFSIESAVGKVHFCLPLRNVWYLVYGERSFAVRFVLNQVLEDGKSQSVATTDKVTFAEPVETTGPTSAAPESLDAYDAALVKVYSMLEWFAADSRYCAKRFPELAHGVEESFGRWQQKYDLFITQIAKETGHDARTTRRTAEMFKEGARREAEQDVAKHTPEEMRDMCQRFTSIMDGQSDPGGWFLSEFALRQGMQQETGGEPH
jgi:hypothetical protein